MASTFEQGSKFGKMPLHLAALNEHTTLVDLLIEARADLDAVCNVSTISLSL